MHFNTHTHRHTDTDTQTQTHRHKNTHAGKKKNTAQAGGRAIDVHKKLDCRTQKNWRTDR